MYRVADRDRYINRDIYRETDNTYNIERQIDRQRYWQVQWRAQYETFQDFLWTQCATSEALLDMWNIVYEMSHGLLNDKRLTFLEN